MTNKLKKTIISSVPVYAKIKPPKKVTKNT